MVRTWSPSTFMERCGYVSVYILSVQELGMKGYLTTLTPALCAHMRVHCMGICVCVCAHA